MEKVIFNVCKEQKIIDINDLKKELEKLEKDTRKTINEDDEKQYNLGYYQAIKDILSLIC